MLVRIGSGSFRPIRNEGRWSEPQPGWHVAANYGFLDQERWEQVQDYQTPPVMTEEFKKELEEAQARKAEITTFIQSSYGKELARKMALGGTRTIWEMNLRVFSRGWRKRAEIDYMRVVALCGEAHLRRWSWVDAHVKLPLAKAWARILSLVVPGKGFDYSKLKD